MVSAELQLDLLQLALMNVYDMPDDMGYIAFFAENAHHVGTVPAIVV